MRRSPLRAVPPADHSTEPGYHEWKATVYGKCAVCGERGRLERHHVISEQTVRREGGDPWDLRNSLLLGAYCRCHRDHTSAASRLPAAKIPAEAIEFAIGLLGAARADDYFDRHYAP